MNALVMNCSPVRTGATAEIAGIIAECLGKRFRVKAVCIDDFDFGFCKGCRSCHSTAKCVQDDGVGQVIADFDWADAIVLVSPSYWADVPGQFKSFIDRCTPWCNTHEPHAALKPGKRGYAVALRTGPSQKECLGIIGTIEHFFGHMEIEPRGRLALCSVECRKDAKNRSEEIRAFAEGIE